MTAAAGQIFSLPSALKIDKNQSEFGPLLIR